MPTAFILPLLVIARLVGAVPAVARDCRVPAEAQACTTNDDCACGAAVAGGQCAAAARECVVAGECAEYCAAFFGNLTAVCRAGRCLRARASGCPGDCDADAAVGIAELTVGVGIALGRHPLAACANLDADRDGVAAIGELVRAVTGALDGCTATLPRSPELRGYYDARLSGRPSSALATVYQSGERLSLDIAEGPNRTFYLSGPLVDGHLALSGSFIVTDVGYSITGDATVVTDGDTETIAGTLESEFPYEPIPDSFVLRRSSTDDPSRLAGAYTVRFSTSPGGSGEPSTASLRLEIARDGVALSGEGEDRDARGFRLGTLTSGECAVAPQGGLSCSLVYLLATEPLTTPLRLTGALAADDTGSGEFLSGVDPPFGPEPYVSGRWTATRLP